MLAVHAMAVGSTVRHLYWRGAIQRQYFSRPEVISMHLRRLSYVTEVLRFF